MHVVAIPRPWLPRSVVRGAWLLAIATTWWVVAWSRIEQVPVASGDDSIRAALPILLAGLRVAGSAFETLFYFVWWRSSGNTFSFSSALPWFATLSLADAWASTLRSVATDVAEPWVHGIALLAGASVQFEASEAAMPGLAIALGDVGLLALARAVGSAGVQVHETGRGWRGPLLLTFGVWLLVKLIAWWSYDLMRGMSPS